MAIKSKIEIRFPSGYQNPTWMPFGIDTVDTLANWLDQQYLLMISWTGYDPTVKHGRVLIFERFQDEDPVYNPNDRKVNLPMVNGKKTPWLHTLEFFEYCLHELAHDFTRWDEQYCQQRIGIDPSTFVQCEPQIKQVVESLCEYFKKRLIASQSKTP